MFSLFPVSDHRRARGLEALNSLPDRRIKEGIQFRILTIAGFDGFNQPKGLGMLPIGPVGISWSPLFQNREQTERVEGSSKSRQVWPAMTERRATASFPVPITA